jgi:hypothetical protein
MTIRPIDATLLAIMILPMAALVIGLAVYGT